MFSNSHKTIVTVEDHCQPVNEPEVTTSNIARKCFEVVVIEGEVTNEFGKGKIMIRDNHPQLLDVF